MPGASISLSDELQPVISAIGVTVQHPGRLTEAWAAYMLYSTQRRFQTETGPDGVKWKPLARRTTLAKVRGRRRGASNMLRVTTRLYSSLTTYSDELEAAVGTNLIYAGPHQFGGEITQYARSQRTSFKKVRGRLRFAKRGSRGSTERNITIGEHIVRIPARPYLGFSADDQARLVEIGREMIFEENGQ